MGADAGRSQRFLKGAIARSQQGIRCLDKLRFLNRNEKGNVMQRIRVFLLVEAGTFLVAALSHVGVLLDGYEHRPAAIAESVIALALLVGVTSSWVRPAWTRAAGLAAQSFALLGTLVGLFTIAIGVGPRTTADIVYHVGIVAVLIWGIVIATRARTGDALQHA